MTITNRTVLIGNLCLCISSALAQNNFSPEESYVLSNPTSPVYQTKAESGFIILNDGTRIPGDISLIGRCYNDVRYIILGISEFGEDMAFSTKSLSGYGLDNNENKLEANETKTLEKGEFQIEDSEEEPLFQHEDTPDYFDWIVLAQGPNDITYRLRSKTPGYVNLQDGTSLRGEINAAKQVFSYVDVTKNRTDLIQLKIKTDDGKKLALDPNTVASYGVSEEYMKTNEPIKKKSEPVDQVLIDESIAQIKESIGLDIYSKEEIAVKISQSTSKDLGFLPGYVLRKDGSWQIGEVMASDQGYYILVELRTIDGKTENFRPGKFLDYGYFKLPDYQNEFPYFLFYELKSVFSGPDRFVGKSQPGYVEIFDGTIFFGELTAYSRTGFNLPLGDESDPCYERPSEASMSNDIYEIEIKNESGKKTFATSMINRFGLSDIKMEEYNMHNFYSYGDERMNFHPGSITLKSGQTKTGWIAFRNPVAKEYEGILFAENEEHAIESYEMAKLSRVDQQIQTTREEDPDLDRSQLIRGIESEKLVGHIIDGNGEKIEGTIQLKFQKLQWYPRQIIFTYSNGNSEIFDGNNTCQRVSFSHEGNHFNYIPYKGVYVELIKEKGRYAYFRNPFPTTINPTTGTINMLAQYAQHALAGAIADEYNKILITSKLNPRGIKMQMADANTFNPNMRLKFYKKEYLIYDTERANAFMIHDSSNQGLIELLMGCYNYLKLEQEPQEEVEGLLHDLSGEGFENSIQFLLSCGS